MLVFPNAKINLGLHVVEKRNDGFHNIESVFYPIGWSDALEAVTSMGSTVLETSGIPVPGNPESNLILKAYEALKKDFDLPYLNIHLHKAIPMGAGLGGGSSDAAFFLKLVNDKFNLGISQTGLKGYASRLGSDCVFFITNRAFLPPERVIREK